VPIRSIGPALLAMKPPGLVNADGFRSLNPSYLLANRFRFAIKMLRLECSIAGSA